MIACDFHIIRCQIISVIARFWRLLWNKEWDFHARGTLLGCHAMAKSYCRSRSRSLTFRSTCRVPVTQTKGATLIAKSFKNKEGSQAKTFLRIENVQNFYFRKRHSDLYEIFSGSLYHTLLRFDLRARPVLSDKCWDNVISFANISLLIT